MAQLGLAPGPERTENPREITRHDNQPPEPIDDRPFAERVDEIAQPLRDRAEQLIAGLNNSRIDGPETAAAVTTLAGLIRRHMDEMDVARKAEKDPLDEMVKAVQAAFQPSINSLRAAVTQAGNMVDRWRDQERAREAAERRRQEEEAAEARRKAEEAEAAKRAAEQAGDGAGALDAELAALRARDEAEQLQRQAETVRPQEVIRTQVGSGFARTERVARIDDLTKCLAYLRTKHRDALMEAITPVVARLMRAMVPVAGVSIVEREKTVFRS